MNKKLATKQDLIELIDAMLTPITKGGMGLCDPTEQPQRKVFELRDRLMHEVWRRG